VAVQPASRRRYGHSPYEYPDLALTLNSGLRSATFTFWNPRSPGRFFV
jgi:hypothetical protein